MTQNRCWSFIEQHFEIDAEQLLPALAQIVEKRRLVFRQFVEAAIEGT
jgi:hypothetical protein